MKYLVLLVGDGDEQPWARADQAERDGVIAKFEAFPAACKERGVTIVAGEALAEGEGVTTIRHRGGARTVTDGPFAEAAEAIGGFYLLDAPDLDALLDVLTHLPAYDMQVSSVVDPF